MPDRKKWILQMQLCALDSHNTLVFAQKAHKHQDYICLECCNTVRVRSGAHRQPHFYHIKPNNACRQHSKGMAHLLLQYYLKAQLPEDEAFIEYRFADINRIADVVWITKRLVYEIQYSPISAEEIIARNNAYASIGYQVIWILHDQRYNKDKLTSAEDILQTTTHYFSNMNANGEGVVYDELSLHANGLRNFRLPRRTIDLTSPKSMHESIFQSLEHFPHPLKQRAIHWTLYFAGDTLDRCQNLVNNPDKDLKEAIDHLHNLFAEEDFLSKPLGRTLYKIYRRYIAVPYTALFRLFLERACR